MKIVIEIPEEKYLYAKSLVDFFNEKNPVVLAIGNGVPLKKELDKIRAKIEEQEKWLMGARYSAYNVDMALDAIRLAVDESEE